MIGIWWALRAPFFFAPVERSQQIIRQGRAEIIRDPDTVAIHSQGPDLRLLRFHGHQARHRHASPGNDNFFPGRDPLQEARKVGLGLMNVDFHRVTID